MLLLRHHFVHRIAGIFLLFPLHSFAQPFAIQDRLISSLDSISQSTSPAKDFAIVYLKTSIGAKSYFQKDSSTTQALMNRFENCFGDYFIKAAIAYRDSTDIPKPWRPYYANANASALRHILHGINAHINNDLWQALTSEFTLEEIIQLKKGYNSFNHYLQQDYEDIYAYAIASNRRVKVLHSLTIGMDKWYGSLLLKKWRKRQLKIARLFYTNTSRFQKKQKQVERKWKATHRLIAFYF